MKFFLLAALVGFCSAAVVLPTTGRRILFDQDVAYVHGLTGNQFAFKQYPGQKFIEIVLNGVDTPLKKIQIDGETCRVVNLQGFPRMDKTLVHSERFMTPATTQSGYFMNVLKQYQGSVNEYQYKHLLEKMGDEVKEGKVCHIIYHLLTLLDEIVNEDLVEKYFVQKQFGGVFHPQQYQQIFGRYPGYGTNMLEHVMHEMTVPQKFIGYQQPWGYQQSGAYQQPWGNQQWGYNTRFGGIQTGLKDYLLGKVYPMGNIVTPYQTQIGNPIMTRYGYQAPMMMNQMMTEMPYYY